MSIIKQKSEFTKAWILKTAIPIIRNYETRLTIRAVHYLLVARGMTNDIPHYKKVCDALADARWDETLPYDQFDDHERDTLGNTDIERTSVDASFTEAKRQIILWTKEHNKNRWENQPIYPEVFIEKKTLQGVFEIPCNRLDVALNPCKGYPSITYLKAAADRFQYAIREGKEPVMLYFGDYDCTGEDIPRSIKESLFKMGVDIEVRRILLTEKQVREWKLPPAPTKETDSRSRTWDGIGQVELDAVEPRRLMQYCENAISDLLDEDLYAELKEMEEEELVEFKKRIKKDFKSWID